mmetsp:Transcript_29910/g.93542  ORF Transcript_29910/g.93542 Transcript_29910/m.93542 type:complete len:276 (-) Transcript_29910:1170-1997(-)
MAVNTTTTLPLSVLAVLRPPNLVAEAVVRHVGVPLIASDSHVGGEPNELRQHAKHSPLLVDQHVEVQAFGLPLQAKAPGQELVQTYLAAAVSVKELEDCLGLRHVELERAEVRGHLWDLEVLLELFPAQLARLVLVSLREERMYLPLISIEGLHLRLDQHLSVLRGDLSCCGNKCTNHHVQDTDDHEEDVEIEHRLVGPVHGHQGAHGVLPVDAAADGHEEGDHGLGHAAIPFQQHVQGPWIRLPILPQELLDAIHEENGKDVYDHEDHHEAPHQ